MAERRSTFLRLFGDTPILRVMDFFIVHEEFDYSMTDLAELSGVGYSTLKLFWPNLEQSRLVMMTREVGKAKMYRLNLSNPAVQSFKDFYWATTKLNTRQVLAKKSIQFVKS